MGNARRERIYTDKSAWGNSEQIAIAFQKTGNNQQAGKRVANLLRHYNEILKDVIESDMLPESKDRILCIIVRLFRFALREGYYSDLPLAIKNAFHYYLKTKYRKWRDTEYNSDFPAKILSVEQLVRRKP